MAVDQNDLNSLKKLVGKKITSVEPKISWDKSEIESIRVIFDDNTEMRINASTWSGCEECNPDGSNVDYLSFEFYKAKR